MDALAPALKRDYPQLKICWLGDALWACGRAFQIAKDQGWTFVFTFKEGRLPALWREFQALLKLVPEQGVRLDLPDGTKQEYRSRERLRLRGQRAAALAAERLAMPRDAARGDGEGVCLGDVVALESAHGGGRGDESGAAPLDDRA